MTPNNLEFLDIPTFWHAGILRQNYRSHASLLSIPNRLFYGDQLQAAADQQALRPPQWAPLRPVQAQQESSQGAETDEKAAESELLLKCTCAHRIWHMGRSLVCGRSCIGCRVSASGEPV